jgi:hypothetical protein
MPASRSVVPCCRGSWEMFLYIPKAGPAGGSTTGSYGTDPGVNDGVSVTVMMVSQCASD